MVISATDLCFSYDDQPVLRNLSLEVEAGEFLGIIGPNGGGKTTLLKLILGFLKPTKGALSVFGTSPKLARKKLAYVPQTLRFDRQFPLSVLELVLQGRLSHLPWWGRFHKEDIKLAMESLERVGLLEWANAPFSSLSGGQMQRVLIARALASLPEMILLDEPTASVDAHAEAEIYSILRSLKGSMTILMVTHDLRAIVAEVERVLCVQGTATVLSPQQVCEHYALGVYHPPLTHLRSK